MSRALLRRAVFLFAVLPMAIGLSAQQRPQSPAAPAPPLGRIFVTVADQAGTPVLDLGPEAFDVTEAGLRVEIVRASLVTEPMRIALIVDTSEQSKSALNHVRSGLHAFLDAVPPEDELLVMSTGGQARVRVTPTADRKKLTTAVDGLFPEGGAAVLLDGLRESWQRFLRDAHDRWPVFVVIGTDGPDNSSTGNPEFQTFIREIQGRAANAHVIMLTSSRASSGFNGIQASLNVTSYTGGHYESLVAASALPDRVKRLGEQIAAQQKRLRTQYELDYVKLSADPQARIGVSVAREGAGIGLSMLRPID